MAGSSSFLASGKADHIVKAMLALAFLIIVYQFSGLADRTPRPKQTATRPRKTRPKATNAAADVEMNHRDAVDVRDRHGVDRDTGRTRPSRQQRPPASGSDTSGSVDGVRDAALDMKQYEVAPRMRKSNSAGYQFDANHRMGSVKPKQDDITIVTQLTLSRFERLNNMAKAWEGPMSACVFVSDKDKELAQLSDLLKDPKNAAAAKYIDFHVVYKIEDRPYPVNTLRNIAIEQVKTSVMYLLDVDMITSHTMAVYRDIYWKLQERDINRRAVDPKLTSTNAKTHPRLLLITPAFESDLPVEKFPKSKDSLREAVRDGHVQQVAIFNCFGCHSPARYRYWMSEESDTVESYPATFNWYFEPFYLGPSTMEMYDERFEGYGNDKMSMVLELVVAGYQFEVLTNVFIIHMNHAAAPWSDNFNENIKRLNLLSCDFFHELRVKYAAYLKAEGKNGRRWAALMSPHNHSCYYMNCGYMRVRLVGGSDILVFYALKTDVADYDTFMEYLTDHLGSKPRAVRYMDLDMYQYVPLVDQHDLNAAMNTSIHADSLSLNVWAEVAEPSMADDDEMDVYVNDRGLTNVKASTVDASRHGYALAFGPASVVELKTNGGVLMQHLRTQFTIEMWLKHLGWNREVLKAGAVLASTQFFLITLTCFNAINVVVYWDVMATVELPMFEWHHLAFSFQTSTNVFQVIVDGELHASVDITEVLEKNGQIEPTDLRMGADMTPEKTFLEGIIDEVRVWRIVRTAENIKTTMHERMTGSEEFLVAYWNFDEGSGNIALDQTSNEIPAILGGILGSHAEPMWIESTAPVAPYAEDTAPKFKTPVVDRWTIITSSFLAGIGNTGGWKLVGDYGSAAAGAVLRCNNQGIMASMKQNSNDKGTCHHFTPISSQQLPVYWTAPYPFLGSQSHVYGKTLGVTLKVTRVESDEILPHPDISIEGRLGRLNYYFDSRPPATGHTYIIPLTASDEAGTGWRWCDEFDRTHCHRGNPVASLEDFAYVLESVQRLMVRAQYGPQSSATLVEFVVFGCKNGKPPRKTVSDTQGYCQCSRNWKGKFCEIKAVA
eukprot:GFYU01006059.1.p1 GENE.GFYU01006059.1~~GFYU01006059.1.p1  ORF type:complete len:1060 (+),score=309.18 GFYU01006059.1:150-3329(+)